MANDVQMQKTVFNSTEFGKVVDRNFSTFTQPVPIADTDTVDEFYDKIREVAIKNADKGEDAPLTQKQMIDICVVLTDGEAAPLKYYREIKRNWENGESYLGCNYVTEVDFIRSVHLIYPEVLSLLWDFLV